MQWLSALERKCGVIVRKDEDLAAHTTWAVGGAAEAYCNPRNGETLSLLLKMRSDQEFPLWILGGGSNVLVPDEGVKGVVLHTRELDSMEFRQGRNGCVECIVEAGVPLSRWLGESLRRGLSGNEFLVGIPGTMGGALMGNAGSRDRYVGELVQWVETIESDGSRVRREAEEITWSYRFCSLSDALRVIHRCGMCLRTENMDTIQHNRLYYEDLKKRQPLHAKTAGCVFKNPPGKHAGELLDDAGCKGIRSGDAIVSLCHANFIENRGNAKAADIIALIEECRRRVFHAFGILLEPEVRLLGDEWSFMA